MRQEAWGHSQIGRRRQLNEDSVCYDVGLGFFLVTDGMGTDRNGAVAAKMASDALYSQVHGLLSDRVADRDPEGARDRLLRALPSLANAASEAIFNRAQAEVACHGMATTASLLQVVGSFGVIAHIGDSRIHLIRSGQCYRLTEDHTLVAELLRTGALTPEAAATFPHRNVLSRALGMKPTAEMAIGVVDVVPNDRIVICSDGVSDRIEPSDFVRLVSWQGPEQAGRALIALALERGAGDDLSVIVTEVHGEAARPITLPTQQKAGLLGQIFLCKDLTFQEIVRVLAVVHELRAPRGTVIIREGEANDLIYLLAVGRAELSRAGIVMQTLGVGDHFGELALIRSGRHTVTVTAIEDTVLLTLRKADLYNLVRADHGIAIKLLWGFLSKLGETVDEQAAEITRLRARRP